MPQQRRAHSLKWFLAGQTSAASLSFLMYRERQRKRLQTLQLQNSLPPWIVTRQTSLRPIQWLRIRWLNWLLGRRKLV